MSVFSVSRFFAACAAVVLLLSPLTASAAKGTITVQSDGSSESQRIQIDRHGITVTRDSASGETLTVVEHGTDASLPGISVHASGNGIVKLFSDASVPAGEQVDGDVVAVFGSVTVEGEVTGSTVAVFGTVNLKPSAIVHGDAVAVGGGLLEAPGSKVNGQAVQVGFLPLTLGLPWLPVVLATIMLGWLVSLFFGWIGAALFPVRLARIAVTSSRRTAASLALGILSGPMLLVAMVLLLVTVVGIPIAIFLPFLYIGVVYMGQIAAMNVLGCKLTRRRLGEGGFTAPLVSGSLLVTSIFGFSAILWQTEGFVRSVALFFLLVAGLLSMGLAAIGTGAFMLSRAGSFPKDVMGPVPPAPPAAPVA
ncbi:MAG: hypothetical protein K8R56_03740 [Candidatus Eisenbacteria bacterium]|nr:hypothetical protein [Candidatus Eisenbacteria bacterium]